MRIFFIRLLILCLPASFAAAETLQIAVAANFKPALQILAAQFSQKTGHQLKLSSASTGTLYSQINHGAPFDIFFAADHRSVQELIAAGYAPAHSEFCYASGQLQLVGASETFGALADPELSVAIANPATAPYGAAAEAVLQRAQFKTGSARKLLRANNVAQAYQFWHSGGADLALVARSLSGKQGLPIPQHWYTPLRQYALLLPRGRDKVAAADFLNWIRSPTVLSTLDAAGYGRCL